VSAAESSVSALDVAEGHFVRRRLDERSRRTIADVDASGLWPRRVAVAVAAVIVVWSLWGAVAGRGTVLNPAGARQVGRFLAASLHPDLSLEFLGVVVRASLITASYALVGTALAVTVGLVMGTMISETWWTAGRAPASGIRSLRPARRLVLILAGVPRGVHEAVWALILIAVLGRDPLVAVVAIGVSFGSIMAKIVADLIDDRGLAAMQVLRIAGASRVAAMLYGVAPIVRRDVVSYGFYRLECALRTSVVLGTIGAGGLGFELALSFQSLRYEQIWTLVGALLLLSAAVSWLGNTLRRGPSRRWLLASLTATAASTCAAVVWLRIDPSTLVSRQTWRLSADLASSSWPPKLPTNGWRELARATIDTVQLSVLAIAVATLVALPISVLAARRPDPGRRYRMASAGVRLLLLLLRSIPPAVWAFVVLFVVFPGPLPGAIALGLYTVGVLGRLCAEAVENADQRAADALATSGVGAVCAFAYGTLPALAPRFASLVTYRWEVAARETVIVGLVGAGGLGRLLAQQNAAFDRAAMLTTITALIVVSLMIDVAGRLLRRALG
jgi:phosphonate transport system permease protein